VRDRCLELDCGTLARPEDALLGEDRLGDADPADVVQEPGDPQALEPLAADP
jgi:hypothetical protein